MKVSITAIVAVILLCSVTAEAQQDASDGAPSLLANSSLPLTYNATILEGDEQVCPPQEQLEMARTEIDEDVRAHIRNNLVNTTWTCGGITGSWRQVVNIDMTNSSHSCPDGLDMVTKESKRLCSKTLDFGCSSAVFQVNGMPYTNVCGRIIGYQFNSPDAFWPYGGNPSRTIDDYYVDGVALTYGANPRKHIWTFAAAVDESAGNYGAKCPCSNSAYVPTYPIPPWIGSDYFCDAGSESGWTNILYADDPLWDGEGCGPSSSCCSFNSPPWFSKQLSSSTTDDIEMRLCEEYNDEVPIEIIQLYVL